MPTCPTCTTALQRDVYEGTPVARCPTCRGVLLPGFRLEIIKHTRERDAAKLKAEAKSEFKQDTTRKIRCPQCGHRMDKKPIARRYSALMFDVCSRCHSVWLDGGELALVQMAFEASMRGRESLEFQRRMQELESDPERKARFERAVASLPKDLPSDGRDFADVLLEMLAVGFRPPGRF